MAEQYGKFTDNILRLNDGLKEVRAVWKDQTAVTYDHINENMEQFTMKIWAHYSEALSGYEMIKNNYSEDDFDNRLRQIHAKIISV